MQASILSHETQKKRLGEDGHGSVFVAHGGNRKGYAFDGRSEKGKMGSKFRGKGIQCYHCEEIGHVKKNCSHRKSKVNEVDHLGNVNTVIDYGDLLTVSKGKIAYSQDWILDSSSTLHI